MTNQLERFERLKSAFEKIKKKYEKQILIDHITTEFEEKWMFEGNYYRKKEKDGIDKPQRILYNQFNKKLREEFYYENGTAKIIKIIGYNDLNKITHIYNRDGVKLNNKYLENDKPTYINYYDYENQSVMSLSWCNYKDDYLTHYRSNNLPSEIFFDMNGDQVGESYY